MAARLPGLPTKRSLSFLITSTVDHEVVLTEGEFSQLLNCLKYQNKTLLKKLQPFFTICMEDYHKIG